MELCQKHIQAQEKDKTAFYPLAEKWVLLAASIKELEEREFVVDSGASMLMVSKKDIDSAELESDDGGDGQQRGVNQRRRRKTSKNWTYS